MIEHECNFVEEREPEGRLILGPCIECGIPAAEAIKEFSTTKEILRETQENRNKAWVEVNRLTTLLAHYQEALRVKDEALRHQLPLAEHCVKFFKYQREGREFWPNREEAEGVITDMRTALAHQPPSDRKEAV